MSWTQLVARFGSPLYVYELSRLRANFRALSSALPEGASLLYSVKANPHSWLVRELAAVGCGAEVSSPAELDVARSAGIAADSTMYTGPGKTEREVAGALASGARLFSVDSPRQLHIVQRAAEAQDACARVLLRVNPAQAIPGAGLTMTSVPSQFGIDEALIRSQPDLFRSTRHCEIEGFHYYFGTNVVELSILAAQFAHALHNAAALSRVADVPLKMLNLGGGFGYPHARRGDGPQLAPLRSELERELERALPARVERPHLLFESGRFLVAGCGTLIATVVDVKQSQRKRFVILDSGIHHLGGMSALGRLPRIQPEFVAVSAGRAALVDAADIVGPLCTPLDWWVRSQPAARLEVGDHVAVPNVGAYGLTASLTSFLSRECPIELVTDGGEVVDVSAIKYRREVMPAALERHT